VADGSVEIDVIADFSSGDVLSFIGYTNQLTITAYTGGSSLITMADEGRQITLIGVAPNEITLSDFTFA
jgi:hypothetical protein